MNLESIQALVQNHPGLFIALMVWSLIWKGLALWKSSQREEKMWFTVLLVLNTFGILDIIYYYFVGKDDTHATNDDVDGVEYVQDDARL